MPGSDEEGKLLYRASQDLFFRRPLLSRAGDEANFPNKETDIELDKMRQEFVLMKEQDKIIARDLSKTEISNVPDREFKVIIIKILPGLEKQWRTL